jgi:hypothetical protein
VSHGAHSVIGDDEGGASDRFVKYGDVIALQRDDNSFLSVEG